MKMDYTDFSPGDFIKLESFQDWVLDRDHESKIYWENWVRNNPHKKPEVETAREILLSINFNPDLLDDTKVASIWRHVLEHTTVKGDVHGRPAALSRRLFLRWNRVAAVFIGTLLIGLGFLVWQRNEGGMVRVETGFGQTKEVILPDQSRVVLNGNSALEYRKTEFSNNSREVFLRGEAYFSVVHTKNNQEFHVNTEKGVQVEVLGTEFTVTDRPGKNQVVLSKGKVKVALLGASKRATSSGVVLMPGDLAEYHEASGFKKRRVKNPGAYAAFRQNKVVFNNTSLREVARVLEDTYGYDVLFAHPGIREKHFTGSSPADRIDLLLNAIGKSFNLIVQEKDGIITIKTP